MVCNTPFFSSPSAFAVHVPVCSKSTGFPGRHKFIGTMVNCMLPPPCKNSTAYSSGMARCFRKPCSARAAMPSNSGERWLISITDMPLPRQSSSSSRMRSSTGKGSAAGPALKLCTRFTPRPATVVVPTFGDSFLLPSTTYSSSIELQIQLSVKCNSIKSYLSPALRFLLRCFSLLQLEIYTSGMEPHRRLAKLSQLSFHRFPPPNREYSTFWTAISSSLQELRPYLALSWQHLPNKVAHEC